MGRSLFYRLYSAVMGVILLMILAVGGVCFSSLRDERVSSRMEIIKAQAYDVAYFASRVNNPVLTKAFGDGEAARYLNRKANQLYREYGAVVLVIDRQGQLNTNMFSVMEQEALSDSFDPKQLLSYLSRVMEGEEIILSEPSKGATGGLVFTVAVPWMQDNVVLGAVVIQTSAQVIRAAYRDLAWQVPGLMLVCALLCGAVTYAIARRVTWPVRQMTAASQKLAEGDFSQRIDVTGDTEIDHLAETFNSMSQTLENVEMSRREFVANVSHELRSPLTSMHGFVQGMLDGLIPPEEFPHYLAIVDTETKRMTTLVSDLLALSSMERDGVTLDMQPFDINELLRRVLLNKEMAITQKHLDVRVEFGQESQFCLGAPERIEQVARNLVDNAVKFLQDGGTLTLRSWCEGKLCYVTVADNGPGVLPQDRPHIFDRFYKGDKAHVSGKGTGLGLSICKRILQLHHQKIYLEDTPVGCAITFTLDKTDNPTPSGMLMP